MLRRDFFTLLGGAAAWPLAAHAQNEDRKRLAIVMNLPKDDSEAQRGSQALVLKLRELGWLEGRNLDLDFRWVADRVPDLPGIVNEIATLKPDAIVGRSGAVALALQQGAGAIPIVFVDVVAPIEVGLGRSLARPGGNITGFMNFDPPMGTKWLEIITEIAPSLQRIGVLLYPQRSQDLIFKAIADAASSFRVQAIPLRLRDASDIESVLNTFASGGSCGLIVLANSVTNSNRHAIVSLAARLGCPPSISIAPTSMLVAWYRMGSSRPNLSVTLLSTWTVYSKVQNPPISQYKRRLNTS